MSSFFILYSLFIFSFAKLAYCFLSSNKKIMLAHLVIPQSLTLWIRYACAAGFFMDFILQNDAKSVSSVFRRRL